MSLFMRLVHRLFPSAAKEAHIEADVKANVHDPDAYVEAFGTGESTGPVERQRHMSSVTKKVEADELAADLRTWRLKGSPNLLRAYSQRVLLLLFFIVELWALAQVFLGRGFSPAGAYATAFAAAASLVALVKGAIESGSVRTRMLCAATLVVIFLAIGWFRADEFSDDSSGLLDTTAGGVVALVGTAGAAIALHRLGEQTRGAADSHRRFRETVADQKRTEQAANASQAWLERDNVQQIQNAKLDRQLRAEYRRLHGILSAKFHGPTSPASPSEPNTSP